MLPYSGSANLYNATESEVFPAPVLPTTPICSFSPITNEIFLSAGYNSGLYLNVKFLTWISHLIA